MTKAHLIFTAAIISINSMLFGQNVFAQDRTETPEAEFNLPSNPAQWLNSQPISMQQLRGKGAVLYFFEEQ
jgi:hypothetical protein